MVDIDTQKSFYSGPIRLKGRGTPVVTKRAWNLAQAVLTEKTEVPIWRIYISEATQKLLLGDMRGFIVNLAITIETVSRFLLDRTISAHNTTGLENLVSRIPIGQVLRNWEGIRQDSTSWNKLKSELGLVQHVMDRRNELMHKGTQGELTPHKVSRLLDAVKRFVDQAEKDIRMVSLQ